MLGSKPEVELRSVIQMFPQQGWLTFGSEPSRAEPSRFCCRVQWPGWVYTFTQYIKPDVSSGEEEEHWVHIMVLTRRVLNMWLDSVSCSDQQPSSGHVDLKTWLVITPLTSLYRRLLMTSSYRCDQPALWRLTSRCSTDMSDVTSRPSASCWQAPLAPLALLASLAPYYSSRSSTCSAQSLSAQLSAHLDPSPPSTAQLVSVEAAPTTSGSVCFRYSVCSQEMSPGWNKFRLRMWC